MDGKGCLKAPSLRVQTAPLPEDELVPFLGRKITQDGNLDANREVDSSAVNCPEKKHGLHSSQGILVWQPKSNKTKSAKRVKKARKTPKQKRNINKETLKKSLEANIKVTATKINRKNRQPIPLVFQGDLKLKSFQKSIGQVFSRERVIEPGSKPGLRCRTWLTIQLTLYKPKKRTHKIH